jgi:hypothetical protein
MLRVYDNVLPAYDFKTVHDEVMHFDFPWNFGRKSTATDKITNPFLYGFVRTIWDDGIRLYDPYGTFERTVRLALGYCGEKVKDIIRIRVIQNMVADKNYEFGTHVDLEQPHRVGLFYLNDSDGDTIVYNEKFDPALYKGQDGYGVDNITKPEAFTVKGTVTPKANRIVLFDGQLYHSGRTPTTVARRIAINIGYTIDEDMVLTHTPTPTLTLV